MILAACNNTDKKPEPVKPATTSRHSEAFNKGFRDLLASYYSLSESFVNWDSVSVNTEAGVLLAGLDSLRIQDLDEAIHQKVALTRNQIRNDLNALQLEKNITQKRRAFNSLTNNLFELLKQAEYDEKKIYLQRCPMAFNDTEPGDWLSEADTIRNPYLGLHHPTYGSAMLNCGDNRSSIDFTQTK